MLILYVDIITRLARKNWFQSHNNVKIVTAVTDVGHEQSKNGDEESVDSISISGMLTSSHLAGQKVKPRWPSMEGNFVRPFQSSSRSCTSVPVLYTTSVISFSWFGFKTFPTMEKVFITKYYWANFT